MCMKAIRIGHKVFLDILKKKNHRLPIKYDTFKVARSSSLYSLDRASSGEYHMISVFMGLLAYIEQDSLLLIDEPEISLHPNWQIRYMELFNLIFEDYPTCHCLIASHSHFLVSDLKAQSSSILSMTFSDGQLRNELLDIDTEGWSPENILYRIFGVANTRNFYLESDIRSALSIIANREGNIDELQNILERLSRFNLVDNDPLIGIINSITTYISEYDS